VRYSVNDNVCCSFSCNRRILTFYRKIYLIIITCLYVTLLSDWLVVACKGVETKDPSHFITDHNIERMRQGKEANRVHVTLEIFCPHAQFWRGTFRISHDSVSCQSSARRWRS
jgi:hypothetical protein